MSVFAKTTSGQWFEVTSIKEGQPVAIYDIREPNSNDSITHIQVGGICPQSPPPVDVGYTDTSQKPKADEKPAEATETA